MAIQEIATGITDFVNETIAPKLDHKISVRTETSRLDERQVLNINIHYYYLSIRWYFETIDPHVGAFAQCTINSEYAYTYSGPVWLKPFSAEQAIGFLARGIEGLQVDSILDVDLDEYSNPEIAGRLSAADYPSANEFDYGFEYQAAIDHVRGEIIGDYANEVTNELENLEASIHELQMQFGKHSFTLLAEEVVSNPLIPQILPLDEWRGPTDPYIDDRPF